MQTVPFVNNFKIIFYPHPKKTKKKIKKFHNQKKKFEYLLLLEDSSSVGLASRYKSKTAVLNKPINI